MSTLINLMYRYVTWGHGGTVIVGGEPSSREPGSTELSSTETSRRELNSTEPGSPH